MHHSPSSVAVGWAAHGRLMYMGGAVYAFACVPMLSAANRSRHPTATTEHASIRSHHQAALALPSEERTVGWVRGWSNVLFVIRTREGRPRTVVCRNAPKMG
jgi:hypothetical protein